MKKIISFLIAAAMTASMAVSVSADTYTYGLYPKHEKLTSVVVATSFTRSDNSAYNFTVGGREFTLLDKDADGNYFVVANEDYGAKAYANDVANINVNGPGKGEWEYDVDRTDSIAYWLNNGFKTDGNDGKKLPDDILNNIKTSKWEVENVLVRPVLSGTLPTTDTENSAKFKDYRDNPSKYGYDEVRTFNADIVLLSRTEVETYKDRLTPSGNWNGSTVTRTNNINVTYTADKDTLVLRYRAYRFMKNDDTNNLFSSDIELNLTGGSYRVRPAFWLDKDFFKNVKVDVTEAGEYVINELSLLGYTDMAELYDNDELQYINSDWTKKKIPKASNAFAVGAKTAGAATDVYYTYESKAGNAEDGTYFEKYVSDSENGTYTLVSKSTTLDFATEKNGDYVKVAVVPKDEKGNTGKRVWIDPFCLADIGTFVKSAAGDTTGGSATVEISDTTTDCIITLAQYDADGKMINSKSVNTKDAADSTFTVTLESYTAGGTLAVMVEQADGLKPIYYKSL